MTNEKFLEILFDIKKAYAFSDILEAETQTASQLTNDDLEAFANTLGGIDSLPFVVEQAIRAVKTDISQKALSAPDNKRLSVCRKILKKAKSRRSREVFWYASTIDGIQYISDGYRAAAFTTPLPLEEKPDSVSGFDYNGIFANEKRFEESGNIRLEIPDRKELAAYIKVAKAEQKAKKNSVKEVRYNFGKDLPMVNAEYLADMIDIFPNARFYAKSAGSNVYIKDENGDRGVMCYIAKPDGDNEKTVLT